MLVRIQLIRTYRGVAQLGSALDLGSRGRVFESHRSDHYGSLAQLGERSLDVRKVVGPSPARSTNLFTRRKDYDDYEQEKY